MATEEEWACLRKVRYRTRKKAIVAGQRVQRELGRMVAYRCVFCRRYHLGHPVSTEPLSSTA